jgi:hypothetical protein
MNKTDEITAAKAAAGPEAFLWAQDSGDVILWPDEASSQDDDGRQALGRWQVDDGTLQALLSAGLVDDWC